MKPASDAEWDEAALKLALEEVKRLRTRESYLTALCESRQYEIERLRAALEEYAQTPTYGALARRALGRPADETKP